MLKSLLFLACLSMLGAAEECNDMCIEQWDPVCGSDGKTYGNPCKFEAAKCRNRTLTSATGECGKALAVYKPCEGRSEGDTCKVCSPRQQDCMESMELKTCQQGSCKPVNTDVCKEGETKKVQCNTCTCTADGSWACTKIKCDCSFLCTTEINPVCGSNAVTYDNRCLFDNANCEVGGRMSATKGRCPKDCPDACDEIYDPVCGSDTVTYDNKCKFDIANCKLDRTLKAEQGECPTIFTTQCPEGEEKDATGACVAVNCTSQNACPAGETCLPAVEPMTCDNPEAPCPQFKCQAETGTGSGSPGEKRTGEGEGEDSAAALPVPSFAAIVLVAVGMTVAF